MLNQVNIHYLWKYHWKVPNPFPAFLFREIKHMPETVKLNNTFSDCTGRIRPFNQNGSDCKVLVTKRIRSCHVQ
jgi:hypothetical protein